MPLGVSPIKGFFILLFGTLLDKKVCLIDHYYFDQLLYGEGKCLSKLVSNLRIKVVAASVIISLFTSFDELDII